MASKLFLILCIVFLSVLSTPLELCAEKPSQGFFCLRGGFSEDSVGNDLAESFNQYEGSLTLMLPWQWQLPPGLWIKTGLDFTAGVLSGGGDDAFVGSAGPRVSLRSPGEIFVVDAGLAPTYIDDHTFATVDFGGPLQFTNYVGLYAHFLQRLRVGYRFQHMSNAGLYTNNPGLNMHMFEAGFLF